MALAAGRSPGSNARCPACSRDAAIPATEGLSEADIRQVWSGNLLRVLRAAEAQAANFKATAP